ncbi:hypothetical protein [Ramlibacter albus]|uniref:Uncharacterized protein n=1 Tax=Ramlibacter albus TaxID=2079448 RepID=A0A923M4J5_9BURK|nr:hypothetical protein [Ramlibacter albus]MBC5763773.1 hypothetical protein [Ramlibacter albus]
MKYLVHVEARHCLLVMRYPGTSLPSEEKERAVGFYATRVVEAPTLDEAREMGLERVIQEITPQLRNPPESMPVFRAVEVREINPAPMPEASDALTYFAERKER